MAKSTKTPAQTNDELQAKADTGAAEQNASDESAQNMAGAESDAASESDAATADQKISVAKKITVASVYGVIDATKLPALFTGDIENPVANPNPWKRICRISGFATGTKSGMTQYGPWTAFVGDFAGVNVDTGEITMGKTCLIPGAMGEALVESFAELSKSTDSPKMRFSVDVLVKRNAREPAKKYDYKVMPVLEAKLTSPAIALLGMG